MVYPGRAEIVTDIVDELKWRGLIALSTDEEALRKAFADGPVTFYCGFDPTAPSLHMGNLVQLITMRRIQDAGNLPLGLVGGSTGLIGDPKPNAERTLNSKETVGEWVENLRKQVGAILDFEGEFAARIVNNLDWTAPLSAIDFLRDVGKHFRVNRLLAKEAISTRLNSDAGISYTEFSYQLLQAYDFLELHRRYGCTLQTGGSDQWGNLTSGVDLIHRVTGKSMHAMATPLMTKADGTKFGKTESGSIWLSSELTSPYAFFQFWMNADDKDVITYLKVFTELSRSEIDDLAEQTVAKPAARAAQRVLAEQVTTLLHGADETKRVIAASQALFGRGELRELNAATLAAAMAEAPTGEARLGDGATIVDLLVTSGLVESKSAGRRAVKEGGAYVNNVKVTDEDWRPSGTDLLDGGWLVLRRGKRHTAGVRLVG